MQLSRPRTFARVPCLRLIALLLLATAHPAASQVAQGAKGPTEVGVLILQPENVPFVRTLPGRATAFEQTYIRPRVSGLIEEILFEAGDMMTVGDPMFRIENATYVAAVTAAQAALDSARVDADTNAAIVARYRTLQNSAVSQADLQSAEAAAAASQSRIAAAQAALNVAELDLDRTTVTSPIAGVAGLPLVSVGTLVTAYQTDALGSVTRLDPIYIDVSDSSAARLRVRDRIATGELTVGKKLGVTLMLEDGTHYADEGTVIAPGTTVASGTGTLDLRVQFPNPNRTILPGQFLRVDINVGTTEAILVAQRATGRDSDGTLTAFIARDGKARQVDLTSAGSYRNSWVVTQGVTAGDQLIVDGLKNLKDGTAVTTVPVTISDDGTVIDASAAAADGAAQAETSPQARKN